MQLRRATPADIPQMRELEQQTPTAAHWSDVQYHSLFASEAPARVAIVASDDSTNITVSGFLIVRCLPSEWEIENLVVAADTRRRGVASSMVRALLNQAGASGVESIILEVRESNLPARRLYENIGFKQDGSRPAYYQSPVEAALLYRLPLQSCDKIP